jgi:hypothetical protein
VKQLALSSLNTLLVLSHQKGVSCQVDIELIVNSLKATSNPRTQRETLVLLCHVAHLVPVRNSVSLEKTIYIIDLFFPGQLDAPFSERLHVHGKSCFAT